MGHAPYLAHRSVCRAIYVHEEDLWKIRLLMAVPNPPFAKKHSSTPQLCNGDTMIRPFMIAAAAVAVLTLSSTTFAQQQSGGSAAEAKAMLTQWVPAAKAKKSDALAMFTKGEGSLKDRELSHLRSRSAG